MVPVHGLIRREVHTDPQGLHGMLPLRDGVLLGSTTRVDPRLGYNILPLGTPLSGLGLTIEGSAKRPFQDDLKAKGQ